MDKDIERLHNENKVLIIFNLIGWGLAALFLSILVSGVFL